jgi:hypothetical protein
VTAGRAPRRRLWRTTLGALLLALAVLVTLVLPAEYGFDPLGTGDALGLTGLSRAAPAAMAGAGQPLRADRVRFELAPFESVEYKYRLGEGEALVFSWSASAEVVYDFHAEPDGAEEGYAESFETGRSATANGTYVAPFPGIHGWFWENRGMQTVVVDLVSSGFYEAATEFRDGDQAPRDVRPAADVLQEQG